MTFRVGKGFQLPLDAVTQTFAILAKRGVGKTYTASVHAEEMLRAKVHIVVLDPTGAWWGLRAAADGSPSGFAIPILGGDHGDVPLEPTSGETLANFTIDERVSIVLDLSLFRKNEQTRFVTDFLETLYRRNREPVHVFIDEADAFAPQKPFKGQERMLGAVEDIVRRGRIRGIGVTLITQRSAVLNKNVLTQAQILVTLRTIAPQDRTAVDEWIKAHDVEDRRELMMNELPSLPIGVAWYWAPGWPDDEGIFRKVKVRARKTYNSSATPKPGEVRLAPKTLADVDLSALEKRIASTIEKAKREDPKELRRQIAQLEADLRKSKQQRDEVERIAVQARERVVDPKEIERAVREAVLPHQEQNRELRREIDLLRKAIGGVRTSLDRLDLDREFAEVMERPAKAAKEYAKSRLPAIPLVGTPKWNVPETPEDGPLPIGESRILTAAAQYPEGVTREQLTVLTGYARSSRNTYLQRLGARGLIEKMGDGRIRATDSGIKALGRDYDPLPTGDDLREHWLRTLTGGERAILQVLVDIWPRSIHRDALSEKTGYTRSSRNTYLQRLRARQLVQTNLDGPGTVRASDELFSRRA